MSASTAVSYAQAEYDPKQFAYDVAEGIHEATFAQGVWGKSTNLICCFVKGDDTCIQLSTFSRNDYQPTETGPNMRYARKGERYRIEVGKSRTGKPTFLKAELLNG